MVIKVLGTGCRSCTIVKRVAAEVIADLGIDGVIEEVTDIKAIMAYGVTSTPGIVIDEKLVGAGGVPSRKQMVQLIQNAQG